VKGPQLFNGNAAKPGLLPQSTVTVNQTCNVVNQLVNVSWTNFTPSVNNAPGPFYEYNFTYYAVMIAECSGTNPTSYTQCYEAGEFGVPQADGASGPPNAAYAITTSTGTGVGTGQTEFDIENVLENTVLGCDPSHPCSLVVFPDQGGTPGTPASCGLTSHTNDILPSNQGNALATNGFNFTPVGAGACAWANRIVIPLKFAPVPTGCPIRNSVFSVEGSPMMEAAMQQWQPGLCAGKHGLTFSYNAENGEPLAVQDAVSGATDVALTTNPASVDGVTVTKPFVYAPISVSAVAIAYWIDNNITGQQLGGLKLDPSLLLKLLTTSYDPGVACIPHPPPPPAVCDPGVDKNPFYLFQDPEFKQLDKSIATNVNFFGIGNPYVVPTVLQGASDMTWTLTRWIDNDTTAKALLTGGFDPAGMHLNTYYINTPYPTNQFTAQDPIGQWSRIYNPVLPLGKVITFQALNQDAGANTPACSGNTCTFSQDPPEPVGVRRLMAIVDEGDAALNRFPVAAIPNTDGKFVRPTAKTMAAALAHMVSNGSGTLQMNLADKTKNAYPLTMVVYAMAPTSGLSHTKAAAIARFIDFAAGGGQTQGINPGQLPPGYVPLPAKMRAQAKKDAALVLKQKGGTSSNTTNPNTGSTTPTPNASSSPGSSVSLPAVSPSSPTTVSGITLLAAHPKPSAFTRFALPALLIFGGLMAVSGSAALAGSVEGGLGAGLRRLGRDAKARSQAVFSTLRGNRQPSAKPTRNRLIRWRNKP
jgi:hypothetical protein